MNLINQHARNICKQGLQKEVNKKKWLKLQLGTFPMLSQMFVSAWWRNCQDSKNIGTALRTRLCDNTFIILFVFFSTFPGGKKKKGGTITLQCHNTITYIHIHTLYDYVKLHTIWSLSLQILRWTGLPLRFQMLLVCTMNLADIETSCLTRRLTQQRRQRVEYNFLSSRTFLQSIWW